jgi:hypothetical protein
MALRVAGHLLAPSSREGVKKNDESGVHLPQLQNKSSYLLYFIFISFFIIDFFYRVFGRFVTRGVQKRDKNFFQKNSSGLITKNAAFVPLVVFFSPSVVLLDFFIAFLGRFVTRGVQKRD